MRTSPRTRRCSSTTSSSGRSINTTTFWHTFHIHINDYQMTKINGQRVHGLNYDDDVAIPPGGSVTMRTRPTDFTGKFVYHCHVLGHEDAGMMGIVRVVK